MGAGDQRVRVAAMHVPHQDAHDRHPLCGRPKLSLHLSLTPLFGLLAHRARGPAPSSSLAEERTPLLDPCPFLAPLAEAGAEEPLPSSLARSSRTAARQPPPCAGARFPTLAAPDMRLGYPPENRRNAPPARMGFVGRAGDEAIVGDTPALRR